LKVESFVSASLGTKRGQIGKEPAHNPEQTSSMVVIRRRPRASISPCFQSEVFTRPRHFPLK